jgi:hypothetical protein
MKGAALAKAQRLKEAALNAEDGVVPPPPPSADELVMEEELLAAQADLFAAQFMVDFEPQVWADSELSSNWKKMPDGGFEFELEQAMNDTGRKPSKDMLEAAIRDAFQTVRCSIRVRWRFY